MNQKTPIIIFFLFIVTIHARAQYFSTGQDPASIRWRQINTSHFQLIYPEDYEARAQQLAYVFEKVYRYGSETLEHEPRKISVVLHTHTVKSNGLVAWSPRRVELFTTPHQRIYPQDWLQELAVHEFRHVVQMDKIQSELPKLLPILFGEQAAAAAVAAYLPFWFIEGDAVMTETALTKTGRGRLPSFLMESKAQLLEESLYSYDKAALGSYRNYMPDRYHFGYWFAGGIRKKYGAQIWEDVVTEIAEKPFSVTPLDRVLKKASGKNKVELYQQLFSEYRQQWQNEIDERELTDQTQLTADPRFFTDYRYASLLGDGSLVALKESRDDINRIVRLKDGREEVLFTPGIIFQESFSASGNQLIWSEKRPDHRWTHADESVIVIYDVKQHTKKRFRYENKLFSPAISPDGKTFVAVEVDRNNDYFLSLFNAQIGFKINRFKTIDNQCFFTPCWNEKGDQVFYISLSNKGKQLGMLNLKDGKFQLLTPPGFYDIRNPFYEKNKIYFSGSFTGTDNIFCLNLENRELTQVTSVAFGADYPIIKDGQLIFSDYHSKGYQLASLNLNDALAKQLKPDEYYQFDLAETLASQEDTVLDFSNLPEKEYPSENYSKLKHLFNFHSWAPAYLDVNNYDLKPGVSLFSQNKLGTAETQLGYEYNTSEDAGKLKVGFKYSGLYPVFDSELTYGKRRSYYYQITDYYNSNGTIARTDTVLKRFSWNEFNLDLALRVPIYFSQGKYTQLIQPSAEYSYRRISHDSTTPDEYYSGHYHSMAYRLYMQNILLQSEMDVYPNWGQIVELFYRHSPFENKNFGSVAAAHSYLFFPGLVKNHGIRLYGGIQYKKKNSTVSYSDIIKYPRATSSFPNDEMYSFKFDYAMPLCYPDFNIGPLLYLKRVRTSLFYDYAHLKGTIYDVHGVQTGTYSGALESLGVELLGDGHLLRIVAPVSSGIRATYHPNTQNFSFEFLFSINFNAI